MTDVFSSLQHSDIFGSGKFVHSDDLVRAVGATPGNSLGVHSAAEERKMALPSYPNLGRAGIFSRFSRPGLIADAESFIGPAVLHHRHFDVCRRDLR